CSNRTFCYLNYYFRPHRIDARDIFRADSFALFSFGGPGHLLNSAVEGSRYRVPKVQKRVLIEADVDKHRLQPHLDVLDFTLVNAADDIARVFSLDAVFLEPTILEQRDARLELFYAEYEFVAGLA